MANHAIIPWERGNGVDLSATTSNNPMFHPQFDGWRANFIATNVPDDDFVVTAPIPTDIRSDFRVFVRRLAGSVDLPLIIEGSQNIGGDLIKDEVSWDSFTGDVIGGSAVIPTDWTISSNTNPESTGDSFLWNIADNGIMPQMRIAYKNETGGVTTPVWEIIIAFSRFS